MGERDPAIGTDDELAGQLPWIVHQRSLRAAPCRAAHLLGEGLVAGVPGEVVDDLRRRPLKDAVGVVRCRSGSHQTGDG